MPVKNTFETNTHIPHIYVVQKMVIIIEQSRCDTASILKAKPTSELSHNIACY